MKKRISVVILSFFCLLMFVACDMSSEIKIGGLFILSGTASSYGLSTKDGVVLAVEEINAAGGVNGNPLKLMIRDDKNDVETARNMFRELVDEGINVLIGPVNSSMGNAIHEMSIQEKIPVLSPAISNISVIERNDYMFSLGAEGLDAQRKMAEYIINHDGVKRICVVFEKGNDVYYKPWEDVFTEFFISSGGEIINRIEFSMEEERDLFTLLQKSIPEEAEGLMIISTTLGLAAVSQQIHKIDDRLKNYGSNWTMEDVLIELGGDSVESIVMPSMWDKDSETESYLRFRKAFLERYLKEPSFSELCGYESILLLKEVLEKTKGFSKEEILHELRKISSFDGLQDHIVANDKGAFFRGIYLYRVENGDFVKIGM